MSPGITFFEAVLHVGRNLRLPAAILSSFAVGSQPSTDAELPVSAAADKDPWTLSVLLENQEIDGPEPAKRKRQSLEDGSWRSCGRPKDPHRPRANERELSCKTFINTCSVEKTMAKPRDLRVGWVGDRQAQARNMIKVKMSSVSGHMMAVVDAISRMTA